MASESTSTNPKGNGIRPTTICIVKESDTMVKNRLMNTVKLMGFFLILTTVLIFAWPIVAPTIQVGLLMFFHAEFWTIFFIMAGLWFIFGILMWTRGLGRKGDSA